MGEGFEGCREPLVVGDRFGIYNLFLYNEYRGHNYLVGLSEIPEEHVSLHPVIDFIPDDSINLYVSFLEKVVIDDIYGVPPMAFAILGFYNSYGDSFVKEGLSSFLVNGFKLWTVQWFSWMVRPFRVENCALFDYVLSYSRFLPSSYRPELINSKFGVVINGIHFFNYTSFNQCLDINSLRVFLRGSGGDYVLIFPPNIINIPFVCDVDEVYRWFLFGYDRFGERYSPIGYKFMDRVLRFYRNFFEDLLVGFKSVIIPFFVCRDGALDVFYIVYDGRWRVVEGPIYDGDDFVIDPFGEYRGVKMKIYFSLWGRTVMRKGWSIVNYLNFSRYKIVGSRMFYEVRFGGKLIYSSPSRLGII